MTRTSTFQPEPSRAERAKRALQHYSSAKDVSEPAQSAIARLLDDLAHLAAEDGINYGALIAFAQARWLSNAVNAPARPPPKSESALCPKRSHD